MDALIRRAGPEDLDRLLALVGLCFEDGWGASALAGALAAPEARAWIAVELPRSQSAAEAEAVGFVLARRILDLLEIDLVGVRPEARRRGLAVDLLETVLATERRVGLVEARLELSTANLPAERLYAQLGFVVVGRRPRYYPDGTDALLLSRSLDGSDDRAPAGRTFDGRTQEPSLSIAQSGTQSPPPPVRSRARVLAQGPEGNGRRLQLAVPGWPGSRPGQFLMIAAGAEGGAVRRDPLLPRPMAVYRELGPWAGPGAGDGASGPAGVVEVLFRVVGRGTALLADLEPGDTVALVGPLGRGFAELDPTAIGDCGGSAERSADALDSAAPREARTGPALLVGGGSGIASLYEWAKALTAVGRPVTVLLGARSRPDLLGWADFEALGVELIATTEDGSVGQQGLVTAALESKLRAAPGATVYAVGPTPMMRACAGLAGRHDAACFVSLENPMACGFGVCLGCAAPRAAGGFALVCRTGPVFDAREIDWAGLP